MNPAPATEPGGTGGLPSEDGGCGAFAAASPREGWGGATRLIPSLGYARLVVQAVLFDVDFTLSRPGPELGPEGYRRVGERHGLTLDPARYEHARLAALDDLQRHPELEHSEELWVLFTEQIVRGMGGDGDGARACAAEMVAAWELHDHFTLYDDVVPTLEELRRHRLKLGLVSNGQRDLDAFVLHHAIDVDVAVGSAAFGRTKPHPSIFLAALRPLGVEPSAAAMVGDSYEDDIEGARALGMRAFLLDRDDRQRDAPGRLTDLRALPAALGLAAHA
jgi:FMN hydrolase / 5-amino-6-(5-phospho-D-ribitylamino)uracil phosphatase